MHANLKTKLTLPQSLRRRAVLTSYRFSASQRKRLLPVYETIINRRQHLPYSDDERQFQPHRRGRYVEFNLLHDRGTSFNQKGGRVNPHVITL